MNNPYRESNECVSNIHQATNKRIQKRKEKIIMIERKKFQTKFKIQI